MTDHPTVSVVMPTYNTRDCVCTAIDSALQQEKVPVEVIVVDDASSDGTADFVSEVYAQDERVRVIRCEKNGGPSAARNIGFKAARGEWIGLLDSDDWWKPNRLVRLLAHADEADFIADNIMGYDVGAGIETGPIYERIEDRCLHLIDFVLPSAADTHDFGYLQPLIRRQFLVEHGVSYRENVRVGEDLIFNLEFMAYGGRAMFVNEALYVYATPVGLISRAASPYSRSTADTEPLIYALVEIWQRLRKQLSPEENSGFAKRIAVLRREAAIAAFHRARVKREFSKMAKLIASEPLVRQRIVERIGRNFLPQSLRSKN
ncbi:glycosyltransferase family 2 protein [Rhizobium sp. S95]|uniref:Glycosyltransferase family 2 protein n=1 Tax=Ciceribacter sichuanensis TaxID=2949647 RepID=A0AAJ1C1B6_9HYPH|nr:MULTISPECIES: glycosyltransferase family 2 protein [unclassified Ciceribacter]MCM2396078.1 glycosyltransferase family 2 protein [Ciceribacter sp. S95]MCM2401109.1 glycosyltransferase family 2 protein [Ciceribacter sp. S153]MCO5959935.1 glycosyltransferase family 2 protein [Ciceribacter sp. S101]